MNGQEPEMLGDSCTPPRLVRYMNVILGWYNKRRPLNMFLTKMEHCLGGSRTAVSFGGPVPRKHPSVRVQRTMRDRKVRRGEGWHGNRNSVILTSVWS